MRNQMKAFRQELFLKHGILSQPIKMPLADKATPSNVAFAAWRAFAVRVQNEHVWLGIIAGDLTHQMRMSRGQRLTILVCFMCTALGFNAVIVAKGPTAPAWGLWVLLASSLVLIPMLLILPPLFLGLNALVSITHPSHPDHLAYKLSRHRSRLAKLGNRMVTANYKYAVKQSSFQS